MMRPQVVLFVGFDGKVYNGKVIYFDDWYERHLRGEDSKIFEIVFEKDVPDQLRDCDIPQVIDYADQDFQKKTGMTWEDFNELQYWG